MPILVKDYTWTQTENTVHIKIPQRNVNREKVDLFTTDCYLKAHFSPFLFEVFLLHDVDNENSLCIVKDDLITLDLRKRENIEWECLEKELTKPEKMKLRVEIHAKCQEKAKQEFEDKAIKKSQLDRFTVQQAMAIDTKQHKLMDSRRDAERHNAMNALEEWRVNVDESKQTNHNSKMIKPKSNQSDLKIIELADDNAKDEQTGVKIVELPPSDDENKEPKKALPPPRPTKVHTNKPIRKPVKIPVKSEYVDKKREEAARRVLPRLRESAELNITHTPRTFPTPSRESAADEENAWLKNITLARRATGFVSEDLRPEEQDPEWCKAKGDEFFRSGNFLGAISAYTHGISLSNKLPSLYANRSATHFALGNFNKCMQDCSEALDLMKPACEGNRRSRAKCIARRGAALVRLGLLSKGIDEMKAAAKLLPDDETIRQDIYDMERAWEQNPDSD